METSGDRILKLNSPSLSEAFNFKIELSSSENSFSESLLDSLQVGPRLNRICSLSESIELKSILTDKGEFVEPGSVYVFEVDVVCERNELRVIEKVKVCVNDLDICTTYRKSFQKSM